MRPDRAVIDLRSDTVTRPTAAMHEAMITAAVGDDVLGDDPTVLRLQETVAALLGKEAALYVPSGTMANQLALGSRLRPGQQVILEAGAHIYQYEGGAPGALWGVTTALIEGDCGALTWAQIAGALPAGDVHSPEPGLICLENTHNKAGGCILPQDRVVEIGAQARARGLAVHLDGARLWNVHVATGHPLADLCAPCETVSVCFSKGLGAPVGSCLAGPAAVVTRAHRLRKRLGGGMRQAGLLAGACLHALEHHLARLTEDHAHARRLADGLTNPLLSVNHLVETNIVMVDVAPPGTADGLLAHLRSQDILALSLGPGRIRLITHLDVQAADIETALAALNGYLTA